MTTVPFSIPPTASDDEVLVAASVRGDCAAFTRIVERYQNLVCAMAYAATGNRATSEDIGQETFIHAWKNLAQLRDAARLRPWLAGIARNLASNYTRRARRAPLDDAGTAPEFAACPAPSAPDIVASEEEETLVWQSLAHLPPEYREPLVLFYREHQSIEHVATALELSEDAVRQRLSRGRRMLQDRVLARVETTLRKTTPTAAFTVAVAAALPLLTPAPAAAAAGVAAAAAAAATTASGSSAAPSTGIGILGAAAGLALGAKLGLAGAIMGCTLGLLGGALGTRTALRLCRNEIERALVRRGAWLFATLALAFAGTVALLIFKARALWQVAPWLPAVLITGVSFLYLAALLTMITKLNRRFRAQRK